MEPDLKTAAPPDLAGMELPTLIERAEQSYAAGRRSEALRCLREAVRRAPLRADLREMLADAIAGAPLTPVANGHSLADVERQELTEASTISLRPGTHSQTTRGSSIDSTTQSSITKAIGGRAFHRQRRPQSALIVSITVAAILIVALGGAMAFYFAGGRPEPSRKTETPEKPAASSAAVAHDAERMDENFLNKARAFESEGQYSSAIEQLSLIADAGVREQSLAEIHARMGDLYTRDQKFDRALEAYQTSFKHNDRNAKVANDLGYTYYVLGRRQQSSDRDGALEKFGQAEHYFKATLELDGSNLSALESLGRVEIARGNMPGAHQYFQRLIDVAPDSPEAAKVRRDMDQMGLKAK